MSRITSSHLKYTSSYAAYPSGCYFFKVHSDFKYQEKIFSDSPIEVLWTSFKKSVLIEHKDELGIVESLIYPVLEDIKVKCVLCGKIFLFRASEQKWYKKQGFSLPKRRSNFIVHERIKGSGNW